MLDFGMCRKFLKSDGTHRRPRDRLGFRGTVRFASPACHKEEELSRRDDLWSWLFMIVDVSVGKLPWDSLQFPVSPLFCIFLNRISLFQRGTSGQEMMKQVGSSAYCSVTVWS